MKRSLILTSALAVVMSGAGTVYCQLRQDDLDAAVRMAVGDHDAAKVEVAIDQGGSPNSRADFCWPLHKYSFSALGQAAERKDSAAAEVLLRRGADPNSTERWFEPALSIARRKKDSRMITLLQRYGAKE